jgi:hypothetical protein
MRNRNGIALILAGILLLAVLSAGCSDNGQSGANLTTVPTTALAAKFTAGDIIAKTATSTDTFLLIVKYDAATDRYERALAYKKSDGTWYRKDDRTEVTGRSVIERIYPAKVAHVVSLGEVPVVTLIAATTVPTVTVTATTTSYPAPTVSSITPNAGLAGTTVTITSISGTNFRPGASVRLTNVTSSSTIFGTSVTAQSASNITCIFSIPSGAIAGMWNVTVTNPDGQAVTLGNAFTITNATTTTTTTTTTITTTTATTTAPPSPSVSGITPSSAITGMQVSITNLAGSNLLNVTSVKLTKSGQPDITATNVSVVSSSRVTGTINLAGAASGQWNVLVSNSAGQSGIGTNLFTVNPTPLIVAFTASNLTGPKPLIVPFTDLTTGSPTTWSWDFGDENTSISSNPVHTYVFAGDFSVSLTVTNAGSSNSTTQSNYIIVTGGE